MDSPLIHQAAICHAFILPRRRYEFAASFANTASSDPPPGETSRPDTRPDVTENVESAPPNLPAELSFDRRTR
jgi:hypothetical protein